MLEKQGQVQKHLEIETNTVKELFRKWKESKIMHSRNK